MELTDIQKGYLAGLIDGEAYIGLSKSSGKYSPRLCIGMTDYEVLKWLQDLLGGSLYSKKRQHETDSPCWTYAITPNILREILPIITPYLKVKQRQACLMNLYFSYFKQDDRVSMKGLKAVIKDKFHRLFKTMNSRGNRKRGEFKETLSETTLSQALEEIQEKVHRLESDATDIRKEKIINTLKLLKGKIARSSLAKKHYNNPAKNYKQFDGIMDGFVNEGIVKRIETKYNDSCSYVYASNDSTSALPERDDIVRTVRRRTEVENKKSLR